MLRPNGFYGEGFKKALYPLIGFGRKKIDVVDKAKINVTFGQGATMRMELITFNIVDVLDPYNAIFKRNITNKFATLAVSVHEAPNSPWGVGVLSILGSQEEARRCKDNMSQGAKNVHAIEDDKGNVEGFDGNEEVEPTEGVAPAEHTKKVPLCEDILDRMVIVGKGLDEAKEA